MRIRGRFFFIYWLYTIYTFEANHLKNWHQKVYIEAKLFVKHAK